MATFNNQAGQTYIPVAVPLPPAHPSPSAPSWTGGGQYPPPYVPGSGGGGNFGGAAGGRPSGGEFLECPVSRWVNPSTERECRACHRGTKPVVGAGCGGDVGGGIIAQTQTTATAYSQHHPHAAAAYSPPPAPQRQPQPTNNPKPPPPSAPPGQKLLRIQIPPGTAAGATVRVPVPGEGGRQLEATVPPDATEFYVAYAPQGPPPPSTAPPSVYASAAPAAAPSSVCTTATAVAPSVCANPSSPASAPAGAKLQVFEDREYVAAERVTLVLRERAFSYSGDSFTIKDSTGQPWFEVKGRAFSLREKKVLHDADGGGPIWVMKEGFDFGPDRQYVYDPRENVKGRHLFVIQPKMTFFKAKMYAAVRNRVDGRQVQVVLKGVPTQRQAGIFIGEPKQGGERIGTIQRRLTGSDFFFDKQCYVLTVEPGVDVALMIALTIAFDELANDD